MTHTYRSPTALLPLLVGAFALPAQQSDPTAQPGELTPDERLPESVVARPLRTQLVFHLGG